MKFTLSWLNQFVATGTLTPAQIADKLTMLGLEVDSVEELFADLDQIITARVVSAAKHPDADKLCVCRVDTGEGELKEIVCGGTNLVPGMKVAVAKPGAMIDIYPTILDWMGLSVEPHAAGLGRSLLRDAPTVAEVHGIDVFNRMLISDVPLSQKVWSE